MALPLESEIMSRIGLGAHYNWFNGSGSCRHIRGQAVKDLEHVLSEYARENKTAAPNSKCFELLNKIQSHEEDSYTLTKTWQACSDVIYAHISACGKSPADSKKHFDSMVKHLYSRYPVNQQNVNGFSYGKY
jgi:hypothetical protein